MSNDPEQDFFADGISEDIITQLSKYRSFFTIARNSAFSFKSQSIDVREISRKLGVKYIVEGSVRRSGKRVRISAQLINAIEDKPCGPSATTATWKTSSQSRTRSPRLS